MWLLFASDEDNAEDAATVQHNDATTSGDQSDSLQHDVISAGTSSLASSGDASRDAAAASTNQVAKSRGHVVSYVSDDVSAGPPWLPASGDTLSANDRLPSLQHGASGRSILIVVLEWLNDTALYKKPISLLRRVTCQIESHSITCHPTRVNVSPNASQQADLLDLPTPEGWKAELTLMLVIYRDGFCPQTVTHPNTSLLVATQPGVKPANSPSQDWRPILTLPRHLRYHHQ